MLGEHENQFSLTRSAQNILLQKPIFHQFVRFTHQLRLFTSTLVFSVAGVLCAQRAEPSHALLAHYSFATNSADVFGKSPPFVAGQGSLTNRVLYVNGDYDGNGTKSHPLSTPELQALNYQSFTVGLDFYPLPGRMHDRALSPLEVKLDSWTLHYYSRLFARSDWGHRNILTGGEAYRWIGFNRADSVLNLTLNNQAFTHVFKGARVQPNRWHHLLCSVDVSGRQILTWFDGQQLEAIRLPPDFKLEVLASPWHEKDRRFMFANYSNGSMFYGYAANLKIYNRSLTEAEVAGISEEGFSSWPHTEQSLPWLLSLGVIALLAVVVLLCRRHWRRSALTTCSP